MAEDDKHLEIKIRIRPRSIERFIFIVIILALLVLYFFFPFKGFDFGSPASAPATIVAQQEEPEEAAAEPPPGEKPGEEATKETEVQEEKNESAAEAAAKLSGKIEIIITEVITTKSSPDLEHDDKISKIKFRIENGKADFKPKIKVYWFDNDDEDSIKDLVRAEAVYTIKSEAGKTFTDVISSFDMKFLSKTNEGKEIFRLVLYDRDTDKELDRDTYDKTNI